MHASGVRYARNKQGPPAELTFPVDADPHPRWQQGCCCLAQCLPVCKPAGTAIGQVPLDKEDRAAAFTAADRQDVVLIARQHVANDHSHLLAIQPTETGLYERMIPVGLTHALVVQKLARALFPSLAVSRSIACTMLARWLLMPWKTPTRMSPGLPSRRARTCGET
jgi:hypothetical protein